MKDLKLVTYPYPKYGETVLAIKMPQGNIQIADLSKVFTENNSLTEYEKTRKQAEALGERIVLCVNNYEDLQAKLSTAEQRLASAEEIIKDLVSKDMLSKLYGLVDKAEQWLNKEDSEL